MKASLADKLQGRIEGEVRFDDFNRRVYSIDASICQVMPAGVVIPKSRDDIQATLQLARDEGMAIVPRGAATGTAGGCLGDGLVIDCSRHLREILEFNSDEQWAICEPGVVQDQLTARVCAHGLRFGPDTSTGNRATLGGMVGNNSSGAHSMRYGKTVDNVIAVELALADGSCVWLDEQSPAELNSTCEDDGTEGRIHKTVRRLAVDLADEVEQRFPKLQRRVSGYNLDEFVGDKPFNLARLVAGAEGTLGLVTRVKVKLSRSPQAVGLCVIHLHDLVAGLKEVPWLLTYAPFSLELIDRHIIEAGRDSPALRNKLDWLDGHPDGLLVVELDGESEGDVADQLGKLAKAATKHGLGYECRVLTRPDHMESVWAMRKAGVGLLMARRSSEKAIAFLEDIAVPPDRVGDFIADFREYVRGQGKDVGVFGHAGVGQIHTRPMMDLLRQHDVDLMMTMMSDIDALVRTYGGCISGEHGDGLVRSWLIERTFGPKLIAGFREIKLAFDPESRMNPGKIVDPWQPQDYLRVGPGTQYISVDTQFDFGGDGEFALAVEMCNGNAQCRKVDSGVMCPSFEATHDEYATTRARATALQAVMRGELGTHGLADPELHAVLDLCLQCKGCLHECPSQVDMAKLKSEVLYHYQQRHGVPLRSRLFGAVDRASRVGSALAPVSNWVAGSIIGRAGMAWAGLAGQRQLPPYVRERFSTWFSRQPKIESNRQVVLMVDTYTEYNYPHLGKATVAILNALGIAVRLAPYSCCGRPLQSKGLLDEARLKARRLVSILDKIAYHDDSGNLRAVPLPVVGVEPSCILTIRDEYQALIPSEQTERVAAVCSTIDAFLAEQPMLSGCLRDTNGLTVLVHGHCHQKAIEGISPTLQALNALPGATVNPINAGCCGMAGTFGYEAEHYDISMKIGESRLFPAIRQATPGTVVVADGLSCRSQIQHGTETESLHLVELLAKYLKPVE